MDNQTRNNLENFQANTGHRKRDDLLIRARSRSINSDGIIRDFVSVRQTSSNYNAKPQVRPVVNVPAAVISTRPTARSMDSVKSPVLKRKPHLPRQARSNVLKRQMVKPVLSTYKPKKRRSLVPALMSVTAVLIFIMGGGVIFRAVRTNNPTNLQVTSLAGASGHTDVLGIADGPPTEEAVPNDISAYKVPDDSPRFLNIKKINVIARVQPVGVTRDYVLKSPANIFDVGWYTGSVKPGDQGAVVLNGHVSGPTKSGIFYSIGSLKIGDKLSLERGDGKMFEYTISHTEHYDNDKVDMQKINSAITPGKPGLNMVTSAGRFNISTNRFEKRIVVFATQN